MTQPTPSDEPICWHVVAYPTGVRLHVADTYEAADYEPGVSQ